MGFSNLIVAAIALAIGLSWHKLGNRREALGSLQARTGADQSQTQAEPEGKTSAGQRLFYSLFLGGWLIAWSTGITMAAKAFLNASGSVNLFLLGWLIAALTGWFWAVHTLWRLLMGRPVRLNGRDI